MHVYIKPMIYRTSTYSTRTNYKTKKEIKVPYLIGSGGCHWLHMAAGLKMCGTHRANGFVHIVTGECACRIAKSMGAIDALSVCATCNLLWANRLHTPISPAAITCGWGGIMYDTFAGCRYPVHYGDPYRDDPHAGCRYPDHWCDDPLMPCYGEYSLTEGLTRLVVGHTDVHCQHLVLGAVPVLATPLICVAGNCAKEISRITCTIPYQQLACRREACMHGPVPSGVPMHTLPVMAGLGSKLSALLPNIGHVVITSADSGFLKDWAVHSFRNLHSLEVLGFRMEKVGQVQSTMPATVCRLGVLGQLPSLTNLQLCLHILTPWGLNPLIHLDCVDENGNTAWCARLRNLGVSYEAIGRCASPIFNFQTQDPGVLTLVNCKGAFPFTGLIGLHLINGSAGVDLRISKTTSRREFEHSVSQLFTEMPALVHLAVTEISRKVHLDKLDCSLLERFIMRYPTAQHCSLDHLPRCIRLTHLDMSGCPVTDLTCLKSCLTLTHLIAENCSIKCVDGVEALVNLEILNIDTCYQVDDTGLECLGGEGVCPRLKTMSVGGTRVSAIPLKGLQVLHPSSRMSSASGPGKHTDVSKLLHLHVTGMKELSIRNFITHAILLTHVTCKCHSDAFPSATVQDIRELNSHLWWWSN